MAGAALTDRGAAIKTMGGFSHMDIRILGLLNDIAAQNSISSYTGGVSSLSFPQVFSDVTGINQMSVNDLFSALFPTNSVNVKVGNCSVTDKTWQRRDFPSWRFFQNNVSADSLNSWRAAGQSRQVWKHTYSGNSRKWVSGKWQ